jgi:hypothetical protein
MSSERAILTSGIGADRASRRSFKRLPERFFAGTVLSTGNQPRARERVESARYRFANPAAWLDVLLDSRPSEWDVSKVESTPY